jgi:protein-L-isoaspartate(D-aspartate) O-methyltransferase
MLGRHRSNELKFKRRRHALVEELYEKGIRDQRVLTAVGTIPRHLFVDTALQNRAYEDTALPIQKRQTISQPFTVARQTELLQVKEGDKILEVGTGSGYQCAVLCQMGAKVYSVERHRELYERAREILEQIGYKAMLKCGDGTMGWSAYAPYDGIIVTAGAPVVPENLEKQLAIGGRLIIPVGDSKKQMMLRLTRVSEDEIEEERFSNFKFVPLIGKKGWDDKS